MTSPLPGDGVPAPILSASEAVIAQARSSEDLVAVPSQASPGLQTVELRAVRILRYLAVVLAGSVVAVLLALLGTTARALTNELRSERALVERLAQLHFENEATADAHPSAAPRSPKPPLDLRLTDRHTAKALMAVVTVLVLAVTLLPLVLIKSAFSLRMTSDRSQDPTATTSANRQDIGPSWPGAALIKSLADVFIATTRTPKAGAAP